MATAVHKPPMRDDQIAVHQPSPLEMLNAAVLQGAGIDTIERLVALQERMLARNAEMDFNDAMNRAQTELGPVAADLTNPQTKSKYASYAAIDRKVRPVYSQHGLSLSFDSGEAPIAEHVRVLCHVSHCSGHTRTYHLDMPSDGKGAKGGDVMTKTHATGAAMSYGMRYLVKMIFNIAVGEEDADGNAFNFSGLQERVEWIGNARNLAELDTLFRNAYQEASKAGDKSAMRNLIEAKDKRRGELR